MVRRHLMNIARLTGADRAMQRSEEVVARHWLQVRDIVVELPEPHPELLDRLMQRIEDLRDKRK